MGVALAVKYCPDCGLPMEMDDLGIWKCPGGCGEWLRNEEEETAPRTKTVEFQPLGDDLITIKWRTAEKPVLPRGPIVRKGNGHSRSKRKKKAYRPLTVERYILT